jgi:putative DNA primase/helicase
VTTTNAQRMLIAARVPFFQRSGELVRPIISTVKAAHGQLTKTAQLKAVSVTFMRDTMCRHSRWARFDKRSDDWVPAQAPKPIAETLLAREGAWGFPEIIGVIATPTMRPDGSLLVKQGYDVATRLLLIEPPPMPVIPDEPTRSDALKALALLEELISETPFDDEPSRAVALSGLITPVVRGAMTVAPMHVSSAPVAGSGKSFLWDLTAAISTGQRRMPVIAASDEKETEKRLVGAMLTGQPLISIDNVNGELKGDFLCQAIEQQFLDIRALGLSIIKRVETGGVTIYATGNNITIVGDLCRRTITARLDAKLENPQAARVSERSHRHDPQ